MEGFLAGRDQEKRETHVAYLLNVHVMIFPPMPIIWRCWIVHFYYLVLFII